jgi:site-specific recombinase XerD
MVGLKIMQDQVGHRHASTTSIYTGVSDEYRNRLPGGARWRGGCPI